MEALKRNAPTLALAGVLLIAIDAVLTAVVYTGPDGESYSFLNHTVSELGERGVSELAWLFNLALIVGGIAIVVFMLSVAWDARSTGMRVTGLIGSVAGLGAVLVGVFPKNNFDAHKVAAMVFFFSILAASTWHTVVMIRRRRHGQAVAAGIVLISIVAFLVLPGILQPEFPFNREFDPDPGPRPDFWLAAFLEWIVFTATLVWVAVFARSNPYD